MRVDFRFLHLCSERDTSALDQWILSRATPNSTLDRCSIQSHNSKPESWPTEDFLDACEIESLSLGSISSPENSKVCTKSCTRSMKKVMNMDANETEIYLGVHGAMSIELHSNSSGCVGDFNNGSKLFMRLLSTGWPRLHKIWLMGPREFHVVILCHIWPNLSCHL